MLKIIQMKTCTFMPAQNVLYLDHQMQILKSFLEKIIFQLKKLQFLVIRTQKKSFVHKNVPYYSQWESKQLVGKILSHEISAKEDMKWKNSGAETKEEYELWSFNVCGMA